MAPIKIICLDDLCLEVAQERVNYGWKIYQNYGLVTGKAQNIPQVAGLSLADKASKLFPDVHPEGFDIRSEINRDLTNLQTVLQGNYNPQISQTTFMPNYSIETDQGPINASHLAFLGILTPTSYQAIRQKKRKDLKGILSHKDLLYHFNIDYSGFIKFYERIQSKFMGYPVENDQYGFHIRARYARKIINPIDNFVTRKDIWDHIINTYSLHRGTFKNTLSKFLNNPQGMIEPEDPYHNFLFNIFELYDIRKGMDLRSLNALINVLIRDQRILNTHYTKEQVAQKLNLTTKWVGDRVAKGKINSRRISILSEKSRLAKVSGRHQWICDFDLSEYQKRTSKLSYDKLSEVLRKEGLLTLWTRLSPFLRKREFISETDGLRHKSIDPNNVPAIIEALRDEGHYSKDYISYCRMMGLNRTEGFDQFKRDYDKFIKSKKFRRFCDSLDITFDGVPIDQLDIKDEEIDEVVDSLKQKNQERLVRCSKEFPEVANNQTMFVSHIGIYAPDRIQKRNEYRLIAMDKLCAMGLCHQPFGFHTFLKLSDLLRINVKIREYECTLENTIDASELSQHTGIYAPCLRVSSKAELIPTVIVSNPYAQGFKYRYKREDIDKIVKRSKCLTISDIHKIALRERILLSLGYFTAKFRHFNKKHPPKNSGLGSKTVEYDIVYALMFIENLRREYGIQPVDKQDHLFVLKRDKLRAKHLSYENLTAKKLQEMSWQQQHNLALICKTRRDNNLTEAVTKQFSGMFIHLALGKTRAKAAELIEYAPSFIWSAFQEYDLYAGDSFLYHFSKYVRQKVMPHLRKEFPKRILSLHQPKKVEDDKTSPKYTLENGAIPDPQDLTEIEETKTRIQHAVKTLPLLQRAVIERFYLQEKGVRQISEELNLEEEKISKLIDTALNELRMHLK